MKIGLISDIHGNILALETAYKEFEKLGVEKVLCAGDIIGLGPYPEEAVQFLKSKNNLIAIRGNHEGYLLDGIPKIIHARPMTEEETNHHKWIHGRLSESSKEYLNSLPKEQTVKFEDVTIYMVHYPTSKFGIYKEFMLTPEIQDSERLFGDKEADVYVYGHTHVFGKNENNNKLYINLDSTGCPVKTNHITCGILNIEEKNVKFEPLEIDYDVEKVKREIIELKYPFYEKVISKFYGGN